MTYQHILIAVDLSEESQILLEKVVSVVRPYHAKISLIHADVNYTDLYTDLIDLPFGNVQKHITEETKKINSVIAKYRLFFY